MTIVGSCLYARTNRTQNISFQTPFTTCCQEYLDPTFPTVTTTSTMSNITTSTEAPADNIQCPIGFVYNSLMHVCDDKNEVIVYIL